MAATGARLRTMHAPHGSSTTRMGFRSTSLRPFTLGFGLFGLFNYLSIIEKGLAFCIFDHYEELGGDING